MKITISALRGALICDRAAALCDEVVKRDGRQVRRPDLKIEISIETSESEIWDFKFEIFESPLAESATYRLSFQSPDFRSQVTLC